MLGVSHEELSELALSAPAGAGGLVLVPYLEGERTPNKPDATGAIHGLRLETANPAYLARAAVEGMICGLADAVDAVRALGTPVERIILVGGAARSRAVREIASAVLGLPVSVPEPGEYVARGAARQAAWVLAGGAEPPVWPLSGVVSTEVGVDAVRAGSLRVGARPDGTPPMTGSMTHPLDAADPLASYRDLFVGASSDLVYFDGNSLGRPLAVTGPRLARFVEEEWGGRLIRGWDERWMSLPQGIGDDLGRVALGAAPGQTTIGDSTTVLLYKLMRAAVAARPGRTEIVIDRDNFPTDRYVAAGVAEECGLTLRWIDVPLDGGVTPSCWLRPSGRRPHSSCCRTSPTARPGWPTLQP